MEPPRNSADIFQPRAAGRQGPVVDGQHHVAQLEFVGRAFVGPDHAPAFVDAGHLGEQLQVPVGQLELHGVRRQQHKGFDLRGRVAQGFGAPGHLDGGGAELDLVFQTRLVELALEAAVVGRLCPSQPWQRCTSQQPRKAPFGSAHARHCAGAPAFTTTAPRKTCHHHEADHHLGQQAGHDAQPGGDTHPHRTVAGLGLVLAGQVFTRRCAHQWHEEHAHHAHEEPDHGAQHGADQASRLAPALRAPSKPAT
jgi:hypothetical protein